MNSLLSLLTLLPFLLLIAADDVPEALVTAARWKAQYIEKTAVEFPERTAETRCAYLYCRMKDDDKVCKEQCAVYAVNNVPKANSTLESRRLTKDNCVKKCSCFCLPADKCKEPCQKLCDIRNGYTDNQQYDAQMESFIAESIILTKKADDELFKNFYEYVTTKLNFAGFKYNATRLHWNNQSPTWTKISNTAQNNCYLAYCRMGDMDSCRKHCSDLAKHISGNGRHDTIGADEPQCVAQCKSQCKGSICHETCSRLCNIAFKFDDRAEFEAEAKNYWNQLDKLYAEYFENLKKELP